MRRLLDPARAGVHGGRGQARCLTDLRAVYRGRPACPAAGGLAPRPRPSSGRPGGHGGRHGRLGTAGHVGVPGELDAVSARPPQRRRSAGSGDNGGGSNTVRHASQPLPAGARPASASGIPTACAPSAIEVAISFLICAAGQHLGTWREAIAGFLHRPMPTAEGICQRLCALGI